jgi:hypothetical protein
LIGVVVDLSIVLDLFSSFWCGFDGTTRRFSDDGGGGAIYFEPVIFGGWLLLL